MPLYSCPPDWVHGHTYPVPFQQALKDSFNVSHKKKDKQLPVSLETRGERSVDFEGLLHLGRHTF